MSSLNVWFARFQFGTNKRLATYKRIATMLANGVAIKGLLSELYMGASDDGAKPNEGMAIVMAEWETGVRSGQSFSEVIKGWVPESERMIIKAGEEGGDLPGALKSAIEVTTAARNIRRTVANGVFYPIVLLLATTGYLFIFGYKVIPEFTRLIDPAKWGALARSLHWMSQFVIAYGAFVIAGVAGLIALIWVSLPRATGSLRIYLDYIPPWSIYRLVTGAGWLFALSAMLQGKGRIKVALETMEEHASPYLRERLTAFLFGLNSGKDAGQAIADSGFDFPSKDIVQDIRIYTKHGGSEFAEAMSKVARDWMEEGQTKIAGQVAVLKGMGILVMAVILMWIVAGMFAIQNEIGMLARSMGG